MVQPDDHRIGWIVDQLAVTLRDVGTVLSRATAVLLGDAADDGMRATVYALYALRTRIEEFVPVPLTGPASSDIHATVAVAHLGGDLGRLSELTQQMTEIAGSRLGECALRAELRSAVEAMSVGVLSMIDRSSKTVTLESAVAADAASGLERELGAVEGLQRALDLVLVSTEPPVDDASAVELALLGRCYEGCARHAVSAARHVAMLTS